MALIIEDGTGKPDANSFVTEAEAITYAQDRGFAFPSDPVEVRPLLIKAADFILNMEQQMKGLRTRQKQRLPFPRVRVLVNNSVDYVAHDEIPQRLKEAQMRLAISATTTELQPDGSGQEILKEKVGPLEVEYGERGSGSVNPQLNQAMDLLSVFFRNDGGQLIADRC